MHRLPPLSIAQNATLALTAVEELIAEALAPHRNRIVIATKLGFDIVPDGQRRRVLNRRPEDIKDVAEASFKRLKTDVIGLFYQHRVDPEVPLEDGAVMS